MGILMSFFKTNAHDFYISISQIEFNPESRNFEVSIKLTAHDIEYCAELLEGKQLILDDSLSQTEVNKYIHDLVSDQIKMYVNGQDLSFDLIGFEVLLDESLWIYLEFKSGLSSNQINTVEIENKVLIDCFEKQQNHHHLL